MPSPFRHALAALALLCTAACGPAAQLGAFGRVGGLETMRIDGVRYWFGYDYRSDQVISPLLPSADAAADFATANMAQADGARDREFWLAQATERVAYSDLSESGRDIELAPLRAAVAELRRDSRQPRIRPGLVVPEHFGQMLDSNCAWPDSAYPPPAPVRQAVVALGFDLDDMSPWFDESAAILAGRTPPPPGATLADAAVIYLWYWDTLVAHQRHGWAETLALR